MTKSDAVIHKLGEVIEKLVEALDAINQSSLTLSHIIDTAVERFLEPDDQSTVKRKVAEILAQQGQVIADCRQLTKPILTILREEAK